MGYVFLNNAEVFTNFNFQILVDSSYIKRADDVILLNSNLNKLIPQDNAPRVKHAYSCSYMVDILDRGASFSLCNENDIYEILKITDNYILELADSILQKNQRIINYVKKVIVFRKVMFGIFIKVVYSQPHTKEFLESKQDIFSIADSYNGKPSVKEKYKSPPLSQQHLDIIFPSEDYRKRSKVKEKRQELTSESLLELFK